MSMSVLKFLQYENDFMARKLFGKGLMDAHLMFPALFFCVHLPCLLAHLPNDQNEINL